MEDFGFSKTQQALLDMPLSEFINLPNVTSFHAPDSVRLRALAQNNPYMRIGTVLSGGYVIGYVVEEMFDQFVLELGESLIGVHPTLLTLLDRQSLESASILQVQQLPNVNLRGEGVLLGFVDTGIDYMHPAFLYEDGTSKIQYIWDQTVLGNFPPDMQFGSVYSKAQIDEALATDNPLSIVPEQDFNGHGTFIASVAGGRENNNYIGAAPDAQIIAVKLKPANQFQRSQTSAPADNDAIFASDNIMLGIEFILDKADALNRPVAICIGLGSNFGGHAGLSLIEEYISYVNTRRGVVVCTAAGNEANARHHTSGTILSSGDTKTIEVVAGENVSTLVVYIWNSPLDSISAAVESPAGQIIHRIPFEANTVFQRSLALERSMVSIGYFLLRDHLILVKITDPTPGIWRIILQGEVIANGEFHAWLPITGIADPNVEFASPDPDYTVVIPATAIGSLVTGAYDSRDNSLYVASSWGPTRVPRLAPDFTAPGVNVGGAVPGGGHGVFTGTSVAAAITTGASAILLQWGIVEGHEFFMNSARVRALLIRGCDRHPNIQYPNVQWGYGSINLMNSFRVLSG